MYQMVSGIYGICAQLLFLAAINEHDEYNISKAILYFPYSYVIG